MNIMNPRQQPTPPGMNPPTQTSTTTQTTPVPVGTYDWEKFTGQDFVWLIQENLTFDQGLQAYRQFVDDRLLAFYGMGQTADTEFINLPTAMANAGMQVGNIETQDVLDAILTSGLLTEDFKTEYVDSKYWSEFADGLSLSELRRMPYWLTDAGIREVTKKLALAGYITQAGGKSADITNPSDVVLSQAWDLLLRDVVADQSNFATVISNKVDVNMSALNKIMEAQLPNTGIMVNNLARQMIGRSLTDTEMQSVLDTITMFDEDEQQAFTMFGQTPDLETDSVAALQEMMPDEIKEYATTSSMMDLMNWRPTQISGPTLTNVPNLNDPMFGGSN